MPARGWGCLRGRGQASCLERALGDPEISGATSWLDTPADRAWTAPDAEDVLLAMDRFHAIPDAPARAPSWAEWLYFNGRSADAGFYLTFLAGPRLASGRRPLGVRLQLERAGTMTAYSTSSEVDDAALAAAPNLTIAGNRVRVVGSEYHISIDLPAESGRTRATGQLVLQAPAGRSMPPFTIRGAGGWVSGYVVPVISGALRGAIQVGGGSISFDGGAGYHDHNWGFWEGVSWQWGQVQGERLSFVYGRVRPPSDAADPSRIPALLVALGADGPLGYAADVTIREIDDVRTGRPERIIVEGRSDSLQATLDLAVSQTTVTRPSQGFWSANMDFLQLRALYHASGSVAGEPFEFEARGSAETFRGRSPERPPRSTLSLQQ